MGLIHLEEMEFYAFHGLYKGEQTAGSKFLVNLTVETSLKEPAITDCLSNAVDYRMLYDAVKQAMSVKSKMLEHVAVRIIASVHKCFPKLKSITVKVSKINPSIEGKIKCVSISMTRKGGKILY
ncbi:MAG: dihydroneopterin aldolase [Bacteroidia bacterium]|nr:dihydroneopterin aldolase [Bacteroidia bacterium]